MRTPLTSVPSALLVVVLAAGCGAGPDHDPLTHPEPSPTPTTAATTAPATAPAGLTVTEGITPDELLDCLTTAGLDATISDSVPFGVEVPVVELEVTAMTDYEGDPDQGAALAVFSDPEAAADNASLLTLGASDDPTNDRFGVHGNVVRVMAMILKPGTHTGDEDALLGCLPA